jgi:hypothetical protein
MINFETIQRNWKIGIVLTLAFTASNSSMAEGSDTIPYNKTALMLVSGVGICLYTGVTVGLSTIWYKDLNKVPFHFTNDIAGWKQIDKFGHAYSSYLFGKVGIESLLKTGVSRKKSIWLGGAYGFAFLTSIEVIDGHYSVWGFSLLDVAANASGSLLLIGQELAFNKQILSYKYSFHRTPLADIRPEIFGENYFSSIASDYNGQTYWLSLSLGSVIPNQKYLPEWLCISAGYGAHGLMGGYRNPSYDNLGNPIPFFERTRSYYLSLDVDFTKIKTRYKTLKTVFSFLNLLKVPLPTFEINSQGKTKFHPIYF